MPEVIIYHIHNSAFSRPLPIAKRHRGGHRASIVLMRFAILFGLVGLVILAFSYGPMFLTRFANYKLSSTEVASLNRSTSIPETRVSPPIDPRLPKNNHLAIPAIGVDTDIQEATLDNYESALKKGVWRVSDFGAPGETGMPMILAAHRYGYLAWTNLYRRHNSFYNLPKLKVGDRIEVDYQQRKYTYEVYAEGEGPEIMDYSADLILYTCESLTGETRIFKYARLVTT